MGFGRKGVGRLRAFLHPPRFPAEAGQVCRRAARCLSRSVRRFSDIRQQIPAVDLASEGEA